MKHVDTADIVPQVCVVIPGRGSDKEGFIDTENDLPAIDPHIYVSAKGLREMLKVMGWPSPEDALRLREDLKASDEELALRKQQNDQLEAELADANELLDALSVIEDRKQQKEPHG